MAAPFPGKACEGSRGLGDGGNGDSVVLLYQVSHR